VQFGVSERRTDVATAENALNDVHALALGNELETGDLCIVGSDAFADSREHLESWETSHERVADDDAAAGAPVDGQAVVEHVRTCPF